MFSLNQVCEWSDIYVPKGRDTKFCHFNKDRNAIEWFDTNDAIENSSLENIASNLVRTIKVKTYLEVLKTFLEKDIPFSLIGPSGSGTR